MNIELSVSLKVVRSSMVIGHQICTTCIGAGFANRRLFRLVWIPESGTRWEHGLNPFAHVTGHTTCVTCFATMPSQQAPDGTSSHFADCSKACRLEYRQICTLPARTVTLDVDADGVALLTLTHPPVNALHPEGGKPPRLTVASAYALGSVQSKALFFSPLMLPAYLFFSGFGCLLRSSYHTAVSSASLALTADFESLRACLQVSEAPSAAQCGAVVGASPFRFSSSERGWCCRLLPNELSTLCTHVQV